MRVCLVIPPSPFLLDERVFLSLGVLKVAASLESTHQVDVLDLSGVENYLQAVDDYVLTHPNTRRFGMTATSPQMPAVIAINERIPWYTILGGPHATLVAAAAKQEANRGVRGGRASRALQHLKQQFCVVVAGDGEKAIHLAIDSASPRMIDADDPKTALFLSHKTFTESPWPARHLVDFDSYHYEIEGHRATSIIAQLGCPFGCNFCGGRLSPMLRRVRLRSTENIIEEMQYLYEKYKITGFMFYDDELNVNPKVMELMAGITKLQSKLGVSFRLRGFVKAELFNPTLAGVMYEAGFRWLLCGFESGSPTILRNINKRATVEDNTKMLEDARAAGLKVKALMSLGHPGESRLTVQETANWLLKQKPDEFDLTVITVYPGTPYYDEAQPVADGAWCFETNGDRLYHWDIDYTVEQAYYKGVPGEYKSFVWTDYMAAEELVATRDWMEETVRQRLGIPYQTGGVAMRYEHSIGQGLPMNILRSSR